MARIAHLGLAVALALPASLTAAQERPCEGRIAHDHVYARDGLALRASVFGPDPQAPQRELRLRCAEFVLDACFHESPEEYGPFHYELRRAGEGDGRTWSYDRQASEGIRAPGELSWRFNPDARGNGDRWILETPRNDAHRDIEAELHCALSKLTYSWIIAMVDDMGGTRLRVESLDP